MGGEGGALLASDFFTVSCIFLYETGVSSLCTFVM